MSDQIYNAAVMHERFSDLSEMRSYARKMIGHWDRSREKPFNMKSEFDIRGGGPFIWSFVNHAVNLMRTVIELSEKDRMLQAMPLIRLMVENAMTAIWLYLEPSNATAIIKEGFRQRRAAFENLVETEAEGFDHSDIDEIDGILATLDINLPSFEQRCRHIVGGLQIYIHWRLLSTYSHAGMGLGDFYLEEITDRPGLAFAPDAKIQGHESWLGTALCMLVAAMKVCNLIDGKGSLKSQIEQAERKIGVPMEFAKVPAADNKKKSAQAG
ncbi:DUF5677 domain-containing protein [Arthrobacter wenxiniae]|uniref:Uncharacterized protein n=1 Tax=Arthrobacter wenxiniae TaxID=2713570 RepID=A0A7Y7III5_9MICC|nr:DUF5677 domain-containing protein [Arthrobacter wenxiniae]NVM96077.1 hypothetical protein [Arthrobacter wenxiniae]